MRKPPKKSIQYELVKQSVELLCAKGLVEIETHEPRKIKEAVSRYKQENNILGTLHFTCDSMGFERNGKMMYKLSITRIAI